MTILVDPTAWSGFGGSPPFWWEALATDDRWWLYDDGGPGGGPGSDTEITWDGTTPFAAGTLTFHFEITSTRPIGTFVFRYRINGGTVDVPLGNTLGVQTVDVTIPGGMTTFAWSIRQDGFNAMYDGVIAVGDVPVVPPPACDELGRATRAYVSGYDRTRVQQVRLYRFEKRCLVANFNGAFPPARTIVSATWRIDAPEIGVISTPHISVNQRETMLMFASQLGGWANVRAEVTLDNGEIYNTIYRVNVREGSWFFNDQAIVIGPFSVSVSV